MATLFNTKIKDTYQSLLKLEDNTILTTTSKNITDGLGNASPLYMSTTRIGIGTNAPANTLSVVGADSVNNLGVYGASGRLQIRGYLSATYGTLFESTTSGGALMPTTISASKILLLDGQVGINTTSTGAQLHIKGSGSTSATTSLFVQNSSGTAAMTIKDDRSTNLNGTLNIDTVITGGSNLVYVYSQGPGVMLFQIAENQNMYLNALNTTLRSNGTWNSTGQYGTNFLANSWYPQGGERIGWNFGGNALAATGADSQISLIRINPTIGNFSVGTTNQGNALLITPTINQVNTGTHTIRGIYYNPTLTSLTGTTHNAIETVTGDVLLTTTSGQVGIGSVYGGWRLNVDGAIRAQRIDLTGSAGPGHVMLRIDDNGTVLRNNTFNINGGNGNAGQSANLAVGNTDTTVARLYVKGGGTTSGTRSFLVQNNSGTTALEITDDRTSTFGGVVNITPPAITGGTRFFTVKSGNWPTAIIQGFENGNLILGSSTGVLAIDSVSITSRQLTNISFDYNGQFAPNNNLNAYGYSFTANFTNVGAGGTSEASMIRTVGNTATSVGNVTLNQFAVKNTINNTAGTTINRGYFYDPTVTSVVNTQNIAFQSTSGSVNINTATIQASAILQADSTTQGFLPPRMTDAQIRAIASPVNGLVAYNTTTDHLCCYQGGAWVKFNHSPM